MTRNSKLAFVTLLAGLLSVASVATVNASAISPCTGYAPEHCEQMAAMSDVTLFSVAAPVHILAGNGMGQEHFEAMSAANVSLFAVAAPSPATDYLPRYAPEHFEQMTAGAALNNSADASPAAATTVRYGQEHYEEIMAARSATN
ncbi:MAG: hypothetical protein ACR2JW_10690 [Thermomicrobiales bacterium]